MHDDTDRRDRFFVLKGWHIALAVLVILAGLIGLYLIVQQNRVEARLKALRAAGYPTSLTELAQYTKLPEGAENAAEIYRQAFAAYVRPADEANTPVLGKAQWPARGAPLPMPMVEAISQYLAANQKCLALLHDAASIEQCRYEDDYTQATIALPPECRYCEQLLNVAAIYHASQGQAEAAVTCLKDGLRLSDSLRREPALLGHLMRISFAGAAIRGLERSLSLTTFREAQLQELRDMLGRTRDTLDFTEALVTERCVMLENCRNPARLGPSGQVSATRIVPGLRVTWLSDTLDTMADYLEAVRQPPRERLARCREIEGRIRQLPLWHVMIKIMTPAVTRIVELDLRARAHLDLATTALAIERYRLATGKVPGQLEDLAPQYLQQVPVDPFDGKPIRYEPGSPGYLLYSVGEDGRDDGGRERNDKDHNAPYDLCFIVTR